MNIDIKQLTNDKKYCRLCIDKRTGNLYVLRKSLNFIDKFVYHNFAYTIPLKGVNIQHVGDMTFYNDKIILTDYDANCILSINIEDGVVTHLAGGSITEFGNIDGSFLNARLHKCDTLDTHPNGDIYFMDYGNHALKKMDFKNRNIITIWNEIYSYGCHIIDNNHILLSSHNGRSLCIYDINSKYMTTYENENFKRLYYMSHDFKNYIYISDKSNIMLIDKNFMNNNDYIYTKLCDFTEYICINIDIYRDVIYFIDSCRSSVDSDSDLCMIELSTIEERNIIHNMLINYTLQLPTDLISEIVDFSYRY